MGDGEKKRLGELFKALGTMVPLWETAGLAITCPANGAVIAWLAPDSVESLSEKVSRAHAAQQAWSVLHRSQRVSLLEAVSTVLKQHREVLAEVLMLEAGKTAKEALVEVDGSAEVLLKTIRDAALPELNGMVRCKERPPVGVVGLITSFNFPLVVANWLVAPALLARNALVWKPSEKTPLTALAYKAVFAAAMGAHAGLLQIVIGGRDIGEALVAHERVDMVSATGSVAMGKGIKAALAVKKNNAVRPILELGGNNGVIVSEKISQAHLEWSLASLMGSFLGTSGQRCTNTRRLIVHRKIHEAAVAILQKHIEHFIASGAIQSPLSAVSNEYGYGPLIDGDAYDRFERAKKKVMEEGGKILFGKRMLETQYPNAYYVEPALALLPKQTALMHEEIFAPLLFIVPYDDIEQAMAILNAPANAGLVGGIYTQSQSEADRFAAENQAGHGLINSPKGTGTPAFGMGFGGNKASGEGEILNAADPLRAFTREDSFSRIAQNKDVAMDKD